MTLDMKSLRAAFGRFLTGVTVVSSRAPNGDLLGFTANSFSSVSLDPPLLLVCPGKHLSTYEIFRDCKEFGVSILSENQQDISNLFASSIEDRFDAVGWTAFGDGTPLIDGRAAGFVCDTHQAVEAGDHVVLIGKVTHYDDAALPGLGYGPDGYFTRAHERSAEAPQEVTTRASALLEDQGRILLTEDRDLPSVEVPPGQSPLQTLLGDLKARKIAHALSVVYAVYDEGAAHRRIVFRGTTTGPQQGLKALQINTLPYAPIPDPALKSMLTRFAQEHAAQSFGLYIGDTKDGHILPTEED
ncbi:MAG: flavin reductase family protein [Pseudomonadota bacterium]